MRTDFVLINYHTRSENQMADVIVKNIEALIRTVIERSRSWHWLEKTLLAVIILLLAVIVFVITSRLIGVILFALFCFWYIRLVMKGIRTGNIPAIPFYMRRTSGRMRHRR